MSSQSRRRTPIGPVILALALVGPIACSEPPVMLGPLYRPEQAIGAAELEGTWGVPGQGEATKLRVTVQQAQTLAVQWQRPEGDWSAEGVVLTIRGYRYLDLGPTQEQEEWPNGPRLGAHVAFFLDLKGDTLSLWYVGQEYWAATLERLALPRMYHVIGPRPGDATADTTKTLVLAYSADSLQMLTDLVMRSDAPWSRFQLVRLQEPSRFVADRAAGDRSGAKSSAP